MYTFFNYVYSILYFKVFFLLLMMENFPETKVGPKLVAMPQLVC